MWESNRFVISLRDCYKVMETRRRGLSCFTKCCMQGRDVPMGERGEGRLATPPQCPRNCKKVGHETDPLTCIRKHDQI